MHILVLIKRVVDTETRIKVLADGKSIDLSGVQFITAPYDEMALEKAIQIRDAQPDGKVTVMTLGPAAATKELRTALAVGADAALHLLVEESLDARSTAQVLAEAIRPLAPDLVLCGKQATDVDDAAVGPMLAALLDLPCVSFADRLQIEGTQAVVRREVDGETETIRLELPAVVTAQKGLAEARLPGLKGIMAAKKKPLESRDVSRPADRVRLTGLALPPPRGTLRWIEPTGAGMEELLHALRGEKKVI